MRPDTVRLGIVVLLSVVWSLALWLLAAGLFGLDEDAPAATQVTATVMKGSGCADAGDGELITFKQDGKEHHAKLDGCGHREGEPVDVSVPSNTSGELVVHAAAAAMGDSDGRRPLAFILLMLSGFAGGGFAVLWFRPPAQLTLFAGAK
ncbi:hypothetical protein JOF56_001043 [Kibdelosporangium banguiense]|uniref:DUF3592 domain-containing protein n=1 Tax=Kibdelosporangium banguiense TaxID=1365924 RepID=A0ABS4T8A4_9PSEU|nr:hypothetical protein [Kibdelosporangium banguiense]MBP2320658.1 hypothetical protein [Kibdelosporangium banguiense]